MYKVLMVAAGGALGALSRWGLSLLAAKLTVGRFMYGTLAANMLGCFLIGLAFAVAARTSLLPAAGRLFFMTGFLGALTTFSTYALETFNAAREGDHAAAIFNVLVNNLLGLALVLAGMNAADRLFGR
jgi:CrcB protein